MPNVNVYVPKELKERLDAFSSLQLSGIAQRAFEEAVREAEVEQRADAAELASWKESLEELMREHTADPAALLELEQQKQRLLDKMFQRLSGYQRRAKVRGYLAEANSYIDQEAAKLAELRANLANSKVRAELQAQLNQEEELLAELQTALAD